MDSAFGELKQGFFELPALAYQNFDKPFVVEPNASSFAVRAILSQRDDSVKVH